MDPAEITVTTTLSPECTSMYCGATDPAQWLLARLGHQPRSREQGQGPGKGAQESGPLTFLTLACPPCLLPAQHPSL